MSDPFLQPNGTLKNLLGIKDAQELKIAEYQFTATREKQLFAGEVSIPKTFDQNHLKAIHQHIFQDVYGWTGVMRHEPVVLEGFIKLASRVH